MKTALLNFAIATSLALPALAAPDFMAVNQGPAIKKHMLPGAIEIQISQRGQKYFETKLADVLGNMGLSFNEGYFPAQTIESKKTYALDSLTEDAETKKLLKTVRSMLEKWLIGFSLKDIRPAFEIGDTGYIAEFSRFAVVADQNLMTKLGYRDGAVLSVELAVKSLKISSSRVKAYDMNNRFLGKVGFDQPEIEFGSAKNPVKLKVPFYIRINAKGEVEFSTLQATNNLDNVDMSFKYKNMLIPKIAIEIDGNRFEFNQDELRREFDSRLPEVLVQVRSYLADFISTDLPKILNEKAKGFLAGSLEEINRMEPPGAESPKELPLLWGLKVEKINLKTSLNISLAAFVEDQKNINSLPKATDKSRGRPSFNGLPAANYDVVMSLDRAMVNRILQLSFERRLFEKIDLGDGEVMRLTAAPTVDWIAAPKNAVIKNTEAFLKLKAKIQVPKGSVTGIDKWGLKDRFEVTFDIIAKLRKVPNGTGVQVVLHSVDAKSVMVDKKYITWIGNVFKGQEGVNTKVAEKLLETAKAWKTKESVIPGTLPLPPEILGIKLDIEKMNLDPNGHIVMYLKYAQPTLRIGSGVVGQ